MKKIILTIFFVSFAFSQSSISKEIEVYIDDGKNIDQLRLIIEDPQECVTVKEIENEIKYIFSNSNIKISNSIIAYRLYVSSNFALMDNFCFGVISFEIFSYVYGNRTESRVVHWGDSSIYLKSSPYKDYILNKYAKFAKKAIVWINDNKY